MICIHHNKDNDGNTSGAIVKYKYPEAKLIGWDYKDPIPDFEQFRGQEVIMIDITFPLQKLQELGSICKLTVIDHHMSFKKDVDRWLNHEYSDIQTCDLRILNFEYVYKDGIAACEIGWNYLFPSDPLPRAVELVSKYDTWREFGTKEWEENILPFKYGILSVMNSPETFPVRLFYHYGIYDIINAGESIMKYERLMNKTSTDMNSFDVEAYGGLRALALNQGFFSSETLMTKYNEDQYDVMIGFLYTGDKWAVSLRSTKPDVDVSVIAKARGGGGHKAAAGFEVLSFEEIFK